MPVWWWCSSCVVDKQGSLICIIRRLAIFSESAMYTESLVLIRYVYRLFTIIEVEKNMSSAGSSMATLGPKCEWDINRALWVGRPASAICIHTYVKYYLSNMDKREFTKRNTIFLQMQQCIYSVFAIQPTYSSYVSWLLHLATFSCEDLLALMVWICFGLKYYRLWCALDFVFSTLRYRCW